MFFLIEKAEPPDRLCFLVPAPAYPAESDTGLQRGNDVKVFWFFSSEKNKT